MPDHASFFAILVRFGLGSVECSTPFVGVLVDERNVFAGDLSVVVVAVTLSSARSKNVFNSSCVFIFDSVEAKRVIRVANSIDVDVASMRRLTCGSSAATAASHSFCCICLN